MFGKLLSVVGLCVVTSVVQAGPIQVLNNGGFENGLTNWTVTSSNANSGGCDTGWVRGSTGSATQCLTVANPSAGGNAMYSSFDGNGPQFFNLSQSFTLTRSAPYQKVELSWDQAVAAGFSGTPREFNILFATDGLPAVQVYQQKFLGRESSGWVTKSIDLTSNFQAIAMGTHTLAVTFQLYTPQNFTGPAGFGFDNASLLITPKDIPAAPVSAPAGLFVLMTGLMMFWRKFRK